MILMLMLGYYPCSQNSEFRRQNERPFEDLVVWQTEHRFVLAATVCLGPSMAVLVEVSKLLTAHSQVILNSAS